MRLLQNIVSCLQWETDGAVWRKVWKKHNESLWKGRGQGERARREFTEKGSNIILKRPLSLPNVQLHTDWVMGTAVIIWHLLIKQACGQTAHGAAERKGSFHRSCFRGFQGARYFHVIQKYPSYLIIKYDPLPLLLQLLCLHSDLTAQSIVESPLHWDMFISFKFAMGPLRAKKKENIACI